MPTLKPFISDVRIFGLPLREFVPLRQTIHHFQLLGIVLAVLQVGAWLFPSTGPVVGYLMTLFVLGMGVWMAFAPVRRTKEEQAQWDREVRAESDAMVREILRLQANKEIR